jgi:hypothetical protein
LTRYFPGVVFTGNVLAGGKLSNYPAGNDTPTLAAFMAGFLGYAAGDYRLVPGGPCEGRGVDVALLPK